MNLDAGSSTRGQSSAGRRGESVRSDLWVGFTPCDDGGVTIELASKVEPYFGEAIRNQVRELLDSLGVRHADVEIEDQGALPFVIAARVEAAARASGVRIVPAAAPVPGEGQRPRRNRWRRSRLYLPGDEPKYFVNAGLYRPDAIILDLEDAVHPDSKQAARYLVRNALRSVDFARAERMVRINPPPLRDEDLEVIGPERPDVILLPKVESAEEILEVDRQLTAHAGRTADGPPWLMPILETAKGIEHAYEIATASSRVIALTIGLEDYAADLGVLKSSDGAESMYARTRLVNAARAAGIQAIDSVYGDVDNIEGLRRWAANSRRLGFEGMGCVHPRQIEIVHEAFNPDPRRLERAQAIVEAFERAQEAGLGVVSVGSKMIDPPVVKQAQRLVEQARDLGLIRNDRTDGR